MGYMAKPVTTAKTLVTDDGVPIDAVHLPQESDLAIVLAHGFTLSWQRPAVWRIATRLNRIAGVVSFDFRGHGRSGGLSTLGDQEIKDLGVAVAYARELGYERVAAVGFSMGASIVVRYAGLVGGLEAAVSVSGPGHWYYRGTERMRRVHFVAEHRVGRLAARMLTKTRISSGPLGSDAGAARRGGRADLAHPVADRARRFGPLLSRVPRPAALRRRAGAEGTVAGAGIRARRVQLPSGPGRPDRRLGGDGRGRAGGGALAGVAGGAVAGNATGTVAAGLLDLPPAEDPDEASAEEAAEAAGAAAAAGTSPAEAIRNAESLDAESLDAEPWARSPWRAGAPAGAEARVPASAGEGRVTGQQLGEGRVTSQQLGRAGYQPAGRGMPSL